ncbi:MAG: glycosyltransferase [Thermodesulfovibrionales bacterium]|nr:glycosyltransferase [Thermodesulfovibrionales bacterium]
MWILEFLIFSMTAIIIWTLFGYFIFLYFVALLKSKKAFCPLASLPSVSVVIACFNEEEAIAQKVQNLKAIDYPQDKIEFVFVDGGSTDNTLQILTSQIADMDNFRVLKSQQKGKINQINEFLAQAKGEIIVNTDVDALLQQDTIQKIIHTFADEEVAVVGAFCSPTNTIDIERYFWQSQNKGRLLESNAYSSFIVVAPCYAYRRGLIDRFPTDVIADDIYIACQANINGAKTVYLHDALVTETRCPKTHAEFLAHKFRKSNAYLRETLRFLYKLPQMNAMLKMMFLTKIAQQLLLPYALIAWGLLAGAMLTLFRIDIVVFCLLAIILSFIITNRVFASVKLKNEERFNLFTQIKGYILTIFILLATGISYPFFRQDSSYSRLASKIKSETANGSE